MANMNRQTLGKKNLLSRNLSRRINYIIEYHYMNMW